MASDTSFSSSVDSSRRRSTFYVPLTTSESLSTEDCENKKANVADDAVVEKQRIQTGSSVSVNDPKQHSMECIYNPDLSVCSFDWNLDDSGHDSVEATRTGSNERENKLKRYGVVLNASVNIDDDETKCHQHQQHPQRQHQSNTSTPIRLGKSRSRSNILANLPKDGAVRVESSANRTGIIHGSIHKDGIAHDPVLTAKEKSKTLPQNMSLANSLPSKSSFLLHSTPRISLNSSLEANNSPSIIGLSPEPPAPVVNYMFSPKKSLSFIRRTHSTKLSRSNSLLKSLTSKCVDQNACNASQLRVPVKELDLERLQRILEHPSKLEQSVKDIFIWCKDEREEESAVHSDTSYEKACRRGSAPNTPVMGQKVETTSRFTNFFSKRSFRSIPLKRTKSVIKLDRSKRGQGGIRGSRSHESLLSNHAVMSTIDLSCIGAIEVVPVHSSVLGRRHCFQVRGISRGERYYSCGTRQERDLWIYSLRKSISPNKDMVRRMDNSLKMWIYEAKSLPPKKRYFCEIYLDKALYGRTSVKLRADLLFWGEFFDFPDVPGASVITVNVFREADKKKKRDKHVLVGTVTIPIEKVSSRTFTEDWYQIGMEKQDNIIKSTSKEPAPTLRIKCRYQSIDILPLSVYHEFQGYLKEHYKRVCEVIEPIIGVKAKEDIGQALVLLMHSQGMAAAFLSDVVALDLLRVDDQRLTFRGNSLATKSMEAFLKLIGEQYLQDTLSVPIAEIIASDRDCEVDPTKVSGSLSRQQQALRRAVKSVWIAIAESSRNFPFQLRDCFATFRDRLQDLDRDDMADNLISASIFLRFLCPAILSPSLFNITNELPSPRATRNLTLVAKTLQTLANFTRFQGKENFMEFLNDFLEQEASRMKQFLYDISCTDCNMPDNFLDWSGCIDQGKQLSILHNLLSEIVLKLPVDKQYELHPLPSILESITKAKETDCTNFTQTDANAPEHPPCMQYPELEPPKPVESGSGPMARIASNESMSTRSAKLANYNELASSVGGDTQNAQTSRPNLSASRTLLHLGVGGSSYSMAANLKPQSTQSDKTGTLMGTMHKFNQNTVQYSTVGVNAVGGGSLRTYSLAGTTGAYGGTGNGMTTNSLRNEKEKTHTVQSDIRASTLPRYSSYTAGVTGGDCTYAGGTRPENHDREHNGNASYSSANNNLIQIDIDPSTPFNRKSPTPLLKNISYCHYNASSKSQHNGSQLSLINSTSDHSGDLEKNALSLGIPHPDASREQSYPHSVYSIAPPKAANVASECSRPPYGAPPYRAATVAQNPSKMPMSLEDLEDLLNYADEQKQTVTTVEGASSSRSASSSNGCESSGANTKGQFASNGSSVSIGQISNISSSGYQSIPTQSASSSPVELAGQQRIEYVTNKAPPPRKLSTTFIGYNTAGGLKLCLNDRSDWSGTSANTTTATTTTTTTKAELPVSSSISLQLFNNSKHNTAALAIEHRDTDPEMPYQQKPVSRILNNNYVDSAYDVLQPFKRSSPSGQQLRATNSHSAVSEGTVHHMEEGSATKFFGGAAGRLNQASRQKRPIMHGTTGGIRSSGDSMQSESSSDERFSNTTSENYNELDSLTTSNVSAKERTTGSINNGSDYEPIGTGLYGRRLGSSRMPRTNPLMQYKRDDGSDRSEAAITHGLAGSHTVGSSFATSGHREQSFQNRYHRRLSVECARTLSDSSGDETEGDNTKSFNASHHVQHHLLNNCTTTTHHNNSRESDGKRRRNVNKSVEQCEREIQRLQASLDSMRQKLEMSEPLEGDSDKLEALTQQHSDSKIRSIIGRLLTMEEELRQEQYKMSLVLSHKQRVIEAQGQQIAALDAANNRLLSALSNLQNRYENQSNQSDDTTSSHPNAGASSC
uniref:Ras GTPase-activating protein n=1 Tax=Anopheles farauti TaxID=69004 RepID=A0A182QQY8_9DIPT